MCFHMITLRFIFLFLTLATVVAFLVIINGTNDMDTTEPFEQQNEQLYVVKSHFRGSEVIEFHAPTTTEHSPNLVPTRRKECRVYIDWVNYAFVNLERHRTGPGEHGVPFKLTDAIDLAEADKVIKQFSYNGIASDRISLDRAIPDTRHDNCKGKMYYSDLPAVSVIIVFHDEYLSFLLRTVHGIVNRTPKQLLHEIILVDDCSTLEPLKKDLENHMNTFFPWIVKIVRLPNRSGLMRARMEGVRVATAPIVVVMDAHIEVNTNWLPPLLQPIVDDYRVATEPLIKPMHWNTLMIPPEPEFTGRGGFSWHLGYYGFNRNITDTVNPADDYENPVFLGAIMAINRTFFWDIGAYDDQLEIWGGEQYDISFKIWSCGGGKILRVPCSQVAHNYKEGGHHPFLDFSKPYIVHNYNRIVEIWFDEYKEYYYKATGRFNVKIGDITEQMKRRAKCKPFKWFLDNVFIEFLVKFPPNPPKVAEGPVKNLFDPDICIDFTGNQDELGIYKCSGLFRGGSLTKQRFYLTENNEIRWQSKTFEPMCMDVAGRQEDAQVPIQLRHCHLQKGNQYFEYDLPSKTIKTGHGVCLEADKTTMKLYFAPCSGQSSQQWMWSSLNHAAFNELMKDASPISMFST